MGSSPRDGLIMIYEEYKKAMKIDVVHVNGVEYVDARNLDMVLKMHFLNDLILGSLINKYGVTDLSEEEMKEYLFEKYNEGRVVWKDEKVYIEK